MAHRAVEFHGGGEPVSAPAQLPPLRHAARCRSAGPGAGHARPPSNHDWGWPSRVRSHASRVRARTHGDCHPPRPQDHAASGITTIPLEDLEPRQEFVPVQGLESYIAQPRRDPPDVARVVMRDGTERMLVQEGHTRIGAAILRGDHEMPVRLWEFVQAATGRLGPGRARARAHRTTLPGSLEADGDDVRSGSRAARRLFHEEPGWRERCGDSERKNGTPDRPSDSIDVATAEDGGVWYSTHFSDDPDRKFTPTRPAYLSPRRSPMTATFRACRVCLFAAR